MLLQIPFPASRTPRSVVLTFSGFRYRHLLTKSVEMTRTRFLRSSPSSSSSSFNPWSGETDYFSTVTLRREWAEHHFSVPALWLKQDYFDFTTSFLWSSTYIFPTSFRLRLVSWQGVHQRRTRSNSSFRISLFQVTIFLNYSPVQGLLIPWATLRAW